ncbi:MAG: RluA family pseudouridine synthase [Acidimicrobiales bacterium]
MNPGGPGPVVVSVPALLDGVRLDRAVSMLTGVSRSRAAELVASGAVRVGGAPATGRSQELTQGMVLEIALPEPEQPGAGADPTVAFGVVHDDAEVIVVDKAPGLVVHPGAGHREGTLVSGLLARYPDLAELAGAGVCDPDRPGIVQRLDRGTSGLLVVARTERAYRSLTAQLAARTVERRYQALVTGSVAEDRGVVEAPIGRSARTPTKMAVSAGGRPATTAYRVLGRYHEPLEATLLELALETGRTHQIRVHLAAIGHPVVGDDRYGAPGPGGRRARVGGALVAPGRLFLHAARLGFEHPGSAERVAWTSALPDDLASVLGEGRPRPR